MNLTIYLKTSPPPEIQGGAGGGLKQKTIHPLQYKFSCQKIMMDKQMANLLSYPRNTWKGFILVHFNQIAPPPPLFSSLT